MSTSNRCTKTLIATAVASLLLAACSAAPAKPVGADVVRGKLTALQADPQLATLAPVAIKEAEAAVIAAEVPRKDKDEGLHLVSLADSKVDLATSQAKSRLLEDQRKALSEQREGARLDARTQEADNARSDANIALASAAAEKLKADALRQQVADLNAKATERGLVVTLGDLLFATGKSELLGGATSNLGKLAAFLNQYPDRTVAIEGYTDNVGSDASNQSLSQRRADSVKSYLLGQGIAASRLSASGMGEGSPVAGNDTATGRQQNRRVEVIIANTVAAR